MSVALAPGVRVCSCAFFKIPVYKTQSHGVVVPRQGYKGLFTTCFVASFSMLLCLARAIYCLVFALRYQLFPTSAVSARDVRRFSRMRFAAHLLTVCDMSSYNLRLAMWRAVWFPAREKKNSSKFPEEGTRSVVRPK